jgi:hypothetical protein
MRYWRLLVVSFLLTLSIAGCHRKPERALPPPHAQAPAIIPAPNLPIFIPEPVIPTQALPAPPIAPPAVTPPPRKHTSKVRHRRSPSKEETQGESTEIQPAGGGTTARSAPGTAVIGQLSADDASATPADAAQTKHLIDATENKLKKLSTEEQAAHKDSVAQVVSFLSQARQALNMNDLVGAQTLANKAKILVEELSK